MNAQFKIGGAYNFQGVLGRIVKQEGGLYFFATAHGTVLEIGFAFFAHEARSLTTDDEKQLLVYEEDAKAKPSFNYYAGYLMNNLPWILASSRLPSTEVYGPYPTVDVIMQCNSARYPDGTVPFQRRVVDAELRFIGGNKSRPYWVDSKQVPLENDSWFVTHWAPRPDCPNIV